MNNNYVWFIYKSNDDIEDPASLDFNFIFLKIVSSCKLELGLELGLKLGELLKLDKINVVSSYSSIVQRKSDLCFPHSPQIHTKYKLK